MRSFAKLVVLRLLRAYKWAVSPIFPPACRYVPTCSEYAMEAVERYGAVRGGLMALRRLVCCHPFAQGGYDPVVKRSESPGPSTSSGQAFSQSTLETGHPALPQGLKPECFLVVSDTAGSRARPKTKCNQARTSQIPHHGAI
jgi:putative membrane protein insertion efficiency factor